jgi:hypothetical protein
LQKSVSGPDQAFKLILGDNFYTQDFQPFSAFRGHIITGNDVIVFDDTEPLSFPPFASMTDLSLHG